MDIILYKLEIIVVIAILLSGGIGTRLNSDTPKQYIEVEENPILWYCLRIFEQLPFSI